MVFTVPAVPLILNDTPVYCERSEQELNQIPKPPYLLPTPVMCSASVFVLSRVTPLKVVMPPPKSVPPQTAMFAVVGKSEIIEQSATLPAQAKPLMPALPPPLLPPLEEELPPLLELLPPLEEELPPLEEVVPPLEEVAPPLEVPPPFAVFAPPEPPPLLSLLLLQAARASTEPQTAAKPKPPIQARVRIFKSLRAPPTGLWLCPKFAFAESNAAADRRALLDRFQARRQNLP